ARSKRLSRKAGQVRLPPEPEPVRCALPESKVSQVRLGRLSRSRVRRALSCLEPKAGQVRPWLPEPGKPSGALSRPEPKAGQVCAAVESMHNHEPPYAHFDLKPANVLISHHGRILVEAGEADNTSAPTPQIADERGWEPLWGSEVAAATAPSSRSSSEGHLDAVVMDLGSARPARVRVSDRTTAMRVQEDAERFASAPYRAPELWDVRTHCDLDERVDVWSLGCMLYTMMCHESPFERALNHAG
ncbi:hypothetical protein CYMTET_18224, partial [Cymbomonas tetramitiformis]